MSAIVRAGLILATAALFGLSYPPYGSPAVAWFALVPLFIALRGLGPGASLFAGWISGLLMAYAITDFLPPAVAVYYQQGWMFGALLFVACVTVMCCSSHMLFALWYRSRARTEGVLSPLLVAAAWVAAELARAEIGGNPWGTVGYTQMRALPLVQIAEWTGVYGVSFAVVAMNAALADLAVAMLSNERTVRPQLAKLGIAAALAAAIASYGMLRVRTVEAEPPGDVPIAVVQGNIDLGSRWQQAFYGETLEEYLRQTHAAAEPGAAEPNGATRPAPPTLVFWPENAVTFFLADEPLYRHAIGRVLSEKSLHLVTGGPYKAPGDESRVYNSAFSLNPYGEIAGRYDKRVLMPFAEYYPAWMRWVSGFLGRTFDGAREFAPGAPSAPLPTMVGAATVVTCNEALFPSIVNERIGEGGEFILNLANDGWLGVHRYSERVLEMVALRAVEHRRYVVRASSSGGSAVIAPSGRVLVRSKPFAAEVLHASIGPRSGVTMYERLGDAFAWLCVAALAVSLLRALRS